jgi:hypothetical protein
MDLPIAGNRIRELQEDLAFIGYDLGGGKTGPQFTGVYDLNTFRCVWRFQQHFFTLSRRLIACDGVCDAATALYVKKVRRGLERDGVTKCW